MKKEGELDSYNRKEFILTTNPDASGIEKWDLFLNTGSLL
jgi:hypothetical protein